MVCAQLCVWAKNRLHKTQKQTDLQYMYRHVGRKSVHVGGSMCVFSSYVCCVYERETDRQRTNLRVLQL